MSSITKTGSRAETSGLARFLELACLRAAGSGGTGRVGLAGAVVPAGPSSEEKQHRMMEIIHKYMEVLPTDEVRR